MKSQLDPSSNSIIIFCFSVVALLMIPICVCEDHSQEYKNCNNPFSCGNNISNLKYPFWGGNREQYCGLSSSNNPEMQLTCESNVSKITINEIKYRILNWNNTTKILKVARDDYWGPNLCAILTDHYKSSTFGNSQFQRNQIANLTFLYNCVAKGNLPSQFYNITCGGIGGDTRVLYTIGNSSLVPCSGSFTVVTIPLLGTQASILVSQNRLTDALEEGFELRYTGGDFVDCERCVDSGGVCGNDGGTSFRCFCKDEPYTTTCNSQKASSSPSGSKRNLKPILLVIVAVGLAIGFGVAIFFIVVVMKRGICGQEMIFWNLGKFVDQDVKAFMESYDMFMVKQYTYADLKRITNSFQDKLGQGGYGVVYKGCLPDGRLVAVKVISESKASGEDFINEVASIGRTSHINIVSLLGFCYEGNIRALIFEFMPNGSLDKFIYRSGFPNAICDFDWNTLFQIAIDIARGLEYLHQGCIARILHLDIKPQNILLDEDFSPKISDFGLAKICEKKESIVSIAGTRGTIGYMAPEVFSRAFGGVSHKSDVYSYGMLILEMIGGRNNHDTGGTHTTEMYFPDWIYKDLEQNNSFANFLAISPEENEIVRKITMVSLWCIQTNPLDRPSMKKVIDLLEGPLNSVPYPPKPILYSPERTLSQISSKSSDTLYKTNSITT